MHKAIGKLSEFISKALFMCLFLGGCVGSISSFRIDRLNEKIWLLPAGSGGAEVYFTDKLPAECSNKRSKPLTGGGITFTTSCGRSQIFISEYLTEPKWVRKAIATHESFHMLAQHQGPAVLRLRLDVATAKPLPVGAHEIAISKLYRVLMQEAEKSNPDCRAVAGQYSLLKSAEQVEVLRFSEFEWPAEHYMFFEEMMGLRRYLELRSRVNRSMADIGYVAGLLAMLSVEKSISRADWQNKYALGRTPFEIFLQVHGGCSIPSSPIVSVKKINNI